MSATKTRYEVVAGSRAKPGQVLKVFQEGVAYRCGGPATACLRWYDSRRRQQEMFFRKVHGELAPCSNQVFLARYLELASEPLVVG